MAYKRKSDSNQVELFTLWRSFTLDVTPTFRLGDGYPDAHVSGYSHRISGYDAVLVEIKPGERYTLTPAEEQFFNHFMGPLMVDWDGLNCLRYFGLIEGEPILNRRYLDYYGIEAARTP